MTGYHHHAHILPEPETHRKKISPYVLLPLHLLSVFSLAITATPRDQYVLHRICREYSIEHKLPYNPTSDAEVLPLCRTPEVQKRFSQFSQLFMLTIAVPALLAMALGGKLSEHPWFGQKRLAMGDLLGVLIQVLTILTVDRFNLPTLWLLLGSTVCGFLGGGSMYNAMFYAMASSVTTGEERSAFFSVADATFEGGVALAPLTMTLIVTCVGNLIGVFYVVSVTLILSVIYLWALPYDQGVERKQNEKTKSSGGLKSLLNVFSSLKVLVENSWEFGQFVFPRCALALAWFIFQLNFTGLMLVLIPVTSAAFGWTAADDGLALFGGSMTKISMLLVFLPLASRKLREWFQANEQKEKRSRDSSGFLLGSEDTGEAEEAEPLIKTDEERKIALYHSLKADFIFTRIGFSWYTFVYATFPFIHSPRPFTFLLLFEAVGVMALPSIRAALSKMTPAQDVGKLMAAITLINSLGNILAPIVFGFVYRHSVAWCCGLVFGVMGALYGVGLIASYVSGVRRKMVI